MFGRFAVLILAFAWPASAWAGEAQPFYEISIFTRWLAGQLGRLGLPDIGLGLINDADFVGLALLFGLAALTISFAGLVALEADGLRLRAGFYVALTCGLTGAVAYRASLPHPTLGDLPHLSAFFVVWAVAGLAFANLAKSVVAQSRPEMRDANPRLRDRIDRLAGSRPAVPPRD